ncbi:MAG TPA: L-rhamnose mutarotase [Pyrinomonadaceae bacterium]
MTLKPGCSVEYKRRHNPIWPELEAILKNHGVANYSIFLDGSSNHRLFAYVEVQSEEQWLQIARTEPCRRWWAHMKDLMLTNDDNSPVVSEMDEVFHLE